MEWKRLLAGAGIGLALAALVALLVVSGRPAPVLGRTVSVGAPAAAQAAQPGGETQTSEGGQVTITVTWPGPSAGPVFAVAMDTHSVNLDAYDLLQLAALRTDDGREVQPSGWDAPSGGHHRQGTLSFPSAAPDGSALISTTTRTIELVIRDVAGVPKRTFSWTL